MTIDSLIANRQRRKHAKRLAYASEGIMRSGVQVVFKRPPAPSPVRQNVYRIAGVKGEWAGLDALRDKLIELTGNMMAINTIGKAIKEGRAIDGYVVTQVGVKARVPLNFRKAKA